MRVVVFHNVVTEPLDEFDRLLYRTHRTGFKRAMQTFKQRFDVVSLPEMLRRLDEGIASPDALAITFDDGFEGVNEHALPILTDLGLVATAFLPTEAPGGISSAMLSNTRLLHFEELEIAFRLTVQTSLALPDAGIEMSLGDTSSRARAMGQLKRYLKRLPASESDMLQQRVLDTFEVGHDEIAAYASNRPKYRKLSIQQVEALMSAGWTVGGHTRTHPALASVDPDRLQEEIAGNLQDLQLTFGLTNPPFAYPYGSLELVGLHAPKMVCEAGFQCAFTTIQEPLEPGTDRFLLGRYGEKDLLHGPASDAVAMASRMLRAAGGVT